MFTAINPYTHVFGKNVSVTGKDIVNLLPKFFVMYDIWRAIYLAGATLGVWGGERTAGLTIYLKFLTFQLSVFWGVCRTVFPTKTPMAVINSHENTKKK